ncbi:MAG: 50S ribosomal protein L29 [Acidobacteriota bacterium]
MDKLRDLTDEELMVKETELDEQMLKLRFQLGTKQIENPMMIREVRHDIARVKTLKNERRRESERS